MVDCEFAERSRLLQVGRVCGLDGSSCFNFGKSELVATCPTLQAYRKGEIVGGTPSGLDYPGMPHVVRTGRYGDFVTGMPPGYLMGKVRRKTIDKMQC